MTSQSFTEQEKADLIQGLAASIHRLNNKIKNDERHERDMNRIAWRKEKIDRAKVLIEKFTNNGEEEKGINGTGERRLQACS
jgi:hypothetical protein